VRFNDIFSLKSVRTVDFWKIEGPTSDYEIRANGSLGAWADPSSECNTDNSCWEHFMFTYDSGVSPLGYGSVVNVVSGYDVSRTVRNARHGILPFYTYYLEALSSGGNIEHWKICNGVDQNGDCIEDLGAGQNNILRLGSVVWLKDPSSNSYIDVDSGTGRMVSSDYSAGATQNDYKYIICNKYGHCNNTESGEKSLDPEDCSNLIDDDQDGLIDCNDSDCFINPICNFCIDNDGDGYGNPGNSSCSSGSQTDCDDSDYDIHPVATEICDDGIDQDCSGADLPCGIITYYPDSDGDTHYTMIASTCTEGQPTCPPINSQSIVGVDCDDSDPDIHPGVAEICDNIDNNCSGTIDEGSLWSNKGQVCSVGVGACLSTGTYICNSANPADATVCSAAAGTPITEICGNGIDEDCNGADRVCSQITYYPDNDGDTYYSMIASTCTEGQTNCPSSGSSLVLGN
jgi:hypothetical protein